MFFNKYPYTDMHEINLDWIISEVKKLHHDWEDFKILNSIRFYGEHDITKGYPAWSLVSHDNIGYISTQIVPAGIDLTNIDYWKPVADYSSLLADMQERISKLEKYIINDPLIINIPEDYTSVNEAWEKYLKNCIINALVTIKYADGVYEGPQFTIHNSDCNNIRIIGNESTPTNCRIELKNPNDIAFYLYNSTLGYLNGFYIIGNGKSVSSWNYIQEGVHADFNSFCHIGKSLVCDTVYYGLQSSQNSTIIIDDGEEWLTPPYNDNITSYFGKNPITLNTGDAGFFAYCSGVIHAKNAIAFSSADDSLDLGYGFIAEHNSTCDLTNCLARYNKLSGYLSSNGSTIKSHGSLSYNNSKGFHSRCGATIEIYRGDAYSNIYNYFAESNATIEMGGCAGNYALDDSIRVINGGLVNITLECSMNNNTYYAANIMDDSSDIKGLNYINGENNGRGIWRAKSTRGDGDHTHGYNLLGDIMLWNNPTGAGYIGQVCTQEGQPGAWSNFGAFI